MPINYLAANENLLAVFEPNGFNYSNYSLLGLFVGDDAHIVPLGFCKFWRDDVGIVPYERSLKLVR
ncbi:MAG: hypothetical protein IKD04_09395 [Clostridia bacterium]|nr:hypothetical protein [Clostridia bacterium]